MRKNKTKWLQDQCNEIEFLRGYRAEYRREGHCFYLRHPVRYPIYLQNSKVAAEWLEELKLTGIDNAPIRRMK